METKDETIKEILIRRDGITPEKADKLIEKATEVFQEHLENGEHFKAENAIEDILGLEPEYGLQLLK